jgi:hypothetical protein
MPMLLVLIEAAPTISKPFPKRGAFHFEFPFDLPADDVRDRIRARTLA